jgi:hypothetical protein
VEPQPGNKEPAVPARATVGKRRNAMRVLKDQNEEMVVVYELVGFDDTEPPILVFEWGRTSTRLFTYPSNWRDLKDGALLALRSPH